MDKIFDWARALIERYGLPVNFLIAVFVADALALFLPRSWLVRMDLVGWVWRYRVIEWALFVILGVYLALVATESRWIVNRFKTRLRHITSDERALLVKRFLEPNVNTVLAWPHEPGFATLVDAGVLKFSMTDFKEGEQMGLYRFPPPIERYVAKNRSAILRILGHVS